MKIILLLVRVSLSGFKQIFKNTIDLNFLQLAAGIAVVVGGSGSVVDCASTR
jgi:hypothetical protein